MSELAQLLDGVEVGAPAVAASISHLREVHPWLPSDYFRCLAEADGFEGFIRGRGYIRVWSVDAALHFNSAYQIEEFLPFCFLFGTDASAMGYCFDQRHPGHVMSVELAALDDEYLSSKAHSLFAFLQLVGADESFAPQPSGQWGPPTHIRGHVLHEKKPIVLGGSPGDPSNRVLLPIEKHPELCVFWARTLRTVRARTKETTGGPPW